MAIRGFERWAASGLLSMLFLAGCGDKSDDKAGGGSPVRTVGPASAKTPAPDSAVDLTKPEAVVGAWIRAFKAGNYAQANAYVKPSERASALGVYKYVESSYPADPQLKAGEVQDIGGTKYVKVEVTNRTGVAPWVEQVGGTWLVTLGNPAGPR